MAPIGAGRRDEPVQRREAAPRVQDGGVVYVQLERQPPGGQPAWAATEVIDGPALPAGSPGRPRP